jgi:hypothetical protein
LASPSARNSCLRPHIVAGDEMFAATWVTSLRIDVQIIDSQR